MKKLLVIIPLLWGSLGFGDWWITKVDTGWHGGTAIALDSLGYPHILYLRGLKAGLRYASWNPDSIWTIENVDGSVGSPCLTFDSKWRPHIAYLWGYGYKDSSGWNNVGDGGWETGKISMDLDSKDYPHVLGSNMVYNPPKGLYHFWKDSLGWHADTIDNVASCEYGSSIVIDDKDSIHIAYPGPGGFLTYAKKTELGWHKDIIDDAGIHQSMVLDTLQRLCIAYRYNGKLKYAVKDSIGWEITVIDSGCSPIAFPSLAIGIDNYPRILYICNDKDLKYTWWNGSSWSITILDYEICDMAVTSTGIAVDDENYSHITYQNQIEKITKYAVGHGYVGIEESEKLKVKGKKLRVCPNPFIQSTVVQFEDCRLKVEDCGIQIYDMVGRLVKETNKMVIGKDLPTGVYFVKIRGYKPVKIIKIGG